MRERINGASFQAQLAALAEEGIRDQPAAAAVGILDRSLPGASSFPFGAQRESPNAESDPYARLAVLESAAKGLRDRIREIQGRNIDDLRLTDVSVGGSEKRSARAFDGGFPQALRSKKAPPSQFTMRSEKVSADIRPPNIAEAFPAARHQVGFEDSRPELSEKETPAPPQQTGHPQRLLGEQVEVLAQRVDKSGAALDALRQAVSELSRKLDHGFGMNAERMGESARATTLQMLDRFVTELRPTLAAVNQRETLTGLKNEVQKLRDEVAETGRHSGSASAVLASVQAQVGEMRAAFSPIAAAILGSRPEAAPERRPVVIKKLGTPVSVAPPLRAPAYPVMSFKELREVCARFSGMLMLSLAAVISAFSIYVILNNLNKSPLQATGFSRLSMVKPASSAVNLPSPQRAQGAAMAMGAPAGIDNNFLSPDSVVTHPTAFRDPPSPSVKLTDTGSLETGSNNHSPSIQPQTPRHISFSRLSSQARSGNVWAEFILAISYTVGRVVPRNLEAAAVWYEQAAAQNFAPAEYMLALFCQKGVGGVPQDMSKALALYEKAAEQGNIRAMNSLATLMATGNDDRPSNYVAAARWFKEAAVHGYREAQRDYAILLKRGLGVPQDIVASYAWFSVAANQGDAIATKMRDELGPKLSPAESDSAKAMVEAFHPMTPLSAVNDVAQPVIDMEIRPSIQ